MLMPSSCSLPMYCRKKENSMWNENFWFNYADVEFIPSPSTQKKKKKGKEIPSSCLHFLSEFMLFYAFDYSNMKLVLLDCYNYAHWMCSGECILMVISTFQFGSFQMWSRSWLVSVILLSLLTNVLILLTRLVFHSVCFLFEAKTGLDPGKILFLA